MCTVNAARATCSTSSNHCRVRNDRPADDQATDGEHDAGAAVLSLRKTIDLADHHLQRPVDLRVPVACHSSILLGSSTGHRPRTLKDYTRVPIRRYPSPSRTW